ncbi:MFS transporter [Brevibacterium antiquum]|uniref:Predicted arabinose efflux permease, MFS family n=1 Tax=Brevibacterium antiquum CNRZ 918 TaxID=1255637 RepID=A0A2H1JPF4_9MICO|nr:MFS transporter [Brevibacterium antiquum]SMX89367.1 Predicted arabinose efflux permease, MFS family [Brevibacterium antiquum CNRZ 918]
MARAQLWTKDFVVGIGLNLSMAMVFYLLMTSMAGYAVARFSAGEAAAGFASSSFVVGAVVARVLTGKYLDFIGRRKLLIITMAVSILASVAYIFADTLVWLFAIRIIHGIAFGAGNTAIMTAIQSVIPASRRGEGTGYFGTATTLSTALGPYLGVVLPRAYDFPMLFAASAFMSVVAFILCVVIKLPKQELSDYQRRTKWHLKISTLVDRDGLRIGSIMLIAGTAYAAALVFLAGYAADNGVASAASLFFVAFAVASLVARLFVGRLQDTLGDNFVIYPVFVFNLVGNILLAMWPTMTGIILAGVFVGLGFGSLMPCMQAITVKSVPMSRVPVATASFFLLLDAGSGIGPIILGAIMPLTGGNGMFMLCAVLVALGMVVYYIVHGRRRGGRPGREYLH